MFRNRRNSQKPGRELYDCFKKQYPNLGPSTTSPLSSANSPEARPSLAKASASRAMAASKQYADHEHDRAQEAMFNDHDNWRLTPSLLDTNTFNFSHYTNDEQAEFVPQSGSMDPIFHSRAGDLHTPGFSFQLGTPLASGDHNSSNAIDLHGFQNHTTQPPSFGVHNDMMFQQSFAPSAFVHRDSGYETLGQTNDTPSGRRVHSEPDCFDVARLKQRHETSYSNMDQTHGSTMEKFRYFVTLNAATAMIKDPDEIPITYLNKGQAYALSIHDTLSAGLSPVPPRYRTVVRIAFEDEEQRLRPASCWQLWKEGRGSAEAHQRGGKLQAVEFVDPSHNDSEDTKSRPRVDLEMASFDSFAVNWSPVPGSSDCNIAVRFNFLSTDFSHSKGVKGIPVRLCTKTELISSGTPESPGVPTAEVSYCKVKLFRDHGAERKLSNDIAHIKKTIEKLQQQIAQIENGFKDGPKRKRADTKTVSNRPAKVARHKRSWSVSSHNSSDRPAEDDLHTRLAMLQDMFSSTRPVSVLHLRGDEQDDPDAFPVAMPGESANSLDIPKLDRYDSSELSRPSAQSTPTKVLSPSSATASVTTAGKAQQSNQAFQRPVVYEARPQLQIQPQPDWDNFTNFSASKFSVGSTTRVSRQANDGDVPTWIEACDVDQSYEPAPEENIKPVACLYVLVKDPSTKPEDDHYKAVYLMDRTRDALIRGICSKCDIDPSTVGHVLRLNASGLKIVVDDDVVRQIPEGQDITVEVIKPEAITAVKHEDAAAHTSPGTGASSTSFRCGDLDMRLFF